MKQINVKNDRAARLLEEVIAVTGEGKTEAVIRALELYKKSLGASRRAEAAIRFARERIHPTIPAEQLGRAPSKREREELLET